MEKFAVVMVIGFVYGIQVHQHMLKFIWFYVMHRAFVWLVGWDCYMDK